MAILTVLSFGVQVSNNFGICSALKNICYRNCSEYFLCYCWEEVTKEEQNAQNEIVPEPITEPLEEEVLKTDDLPLEYSPIPELSSIDEGSDLLCLSGRCGTSNHASVSIFPVGLDDV